jgi:hypothetical protein
MILKLKLLTNHQIHTQQQIKDTAKCKLQSKSSIKIISLLSNFLTKKVSVVTANQHSLITMVLLQMRMKAKLILAFNLIDTILMLEFNNLKYHKVISLVLQIIQENSLRVLLLK